MQGEVRNVFFLSFFIPHCRRRDMRRPDDVLCQLAVSLLQYTSSVRCDEPWSSTRDLQGDIPPSNSTTAMKKTVCHSCAGLVAKSGAAKAISRESEYMTIIKRLI